MINKDFLSLLSVLNRRKWLAVVTFLSVMAGAVAYLNVTPYQYKVKTKLMLNEQQTGISELGQDLQVSTYQTAQSDPLATIAELAESKRVVRQAIDQVFPSDSDSPEKSTTRKNLTKQLSVKIVPSTNILELSYQHPNPELAPKVLNAITQTLVTENIQAIRSQATAVREFLEQEIPKKRKIAEAAARAENNYRTQHSLVTQEEQTSNLVNSLESLETQERAIIAELQKNNRKTQELQQLVGLNDPQNAFVIGKVTEDNVLQTLQNKLADLDVSITNARSRLTDAHPTVLSLLEERASVSELYQQELSKINSISQVSPSAKITTDSLTQNLTSQLILNQIEGAALQDQLLTLQTQQQQLKSRLEQIPGQQKLLLQLTRKREKAFETLTFLETKLEEAQFTEAQLLSNITILELAEVNLSNKTPSKKTILVLAGFVGILSAVGMILLQEMLDNTLYKDFDMEKGLKVPVIGDLPSLPEIALIADNYNFFLDDQALVEPYRRLLKILESGDSEKSKLIVVSSAVSGEGKSIVASHLGAVSGMLFRRTLIIDANLHHPQQHELFALKASLGLTDILDHPFSLSDLIQPTPIENLSILPCGQPKSRPSLILESPIMKYLLQEAKQHYEWIIIDTASLDDYSDAITLSELSDGLVLVARPNFTPKNVLQDKLKDLPQNTVNLVGIVTNNVKKNIRTKKIKF